MFCGTGYMVHGTAVPVRGIVQSIALAFEHCVLRVVTTCADFARDCDIQRDKSKDPFQPGVVYANFVRTQCSNASAIDCT